MAEKPEKPYRTVNIPTILLKEIEELIKQGKVLHHTKSSFIEDAVRRHIEYTINRDKLPKEFLEIFQYALDQNRKATKGFQ